MAYNFQSYAKQAVPRYNSYPRVSQFTPNIGPEAYAAWLSQLDPNAPVSLYLHVPSYSSKTCQMKQASKKAPMADYAKALAQEAQLVAQHLPDGCKIIRFSRTNDDQAIPPSINRRASAR